MKLNNKGYFDMLDCIIPIFLIITLIFVPLFEYLMFKNKAEIESKLYNERFGTHYTTHDFFWSGDTIKDYLNMGKQETYNVNLLQTSRRYRRP